MSHERTPNFGFELVDFNRRPWHEDEHNNWVLADALIARYLSITNVQGIWQNATAVVVGDRYVDADLGTIWEVLIAHTTPSSGTFAAARAATSGRWLSVSSTFTNAGAWTANTAYSINDVVTDSNRVGIVAAAHTSVTSYNTGVTAGNIITLIDLATQLAAAAASAAAAAVSAASIALPLAITSGGTGAITAAAARTALGVVPGTDVQAFDAFLLSIAALGTAADKFIYTTAANVAAEADITAAGRAILDDAAASNQRTTLGLGTAAVEAAAAGTGSLARDNLVTHIAGGDTLTGGFNATAFNAGTQSTGTFTPAPLSGNLQRAVNGGAHTLAVPATDCSMVIQYTNNASAGTITVSGYTEQTGEALTTTDGNDFLLFITRINSFIILHIRALQ